MRAHCERLLTTLAAHPPHCHACGYDTTSIAPDATRCPECGAEFSAWRSRWHSRLTLHALSLIVFGSAACAGVWMLNHAVRSWFSAAAAQGADMLAVIRPTEALIFLPGIMTLAGIALLASVSEPNSARRRFALIVTTTTAVVLCVMLAQRSLAGSGMYDGPVWMRLASIRNAGWWACAVLVPLCTGAALSLLSVTARSVGLESLSLWCARATVWLPLAALLSIAMCEVYQYLAETALRVVSSTPTPISPRGLPQSARGVVFPTPPPFTPIPWYWTTGVQFSRLMLYVFFIAAATTIWLAAYLTRLRVRDALDPNR